MRSWPVSVFYAEYDQIIKVFFFNVIIEDLSKLPFIEDLMEAFILYQMDYYSVLIEDSNINEIEFRYLTVLDLLTIQLSRGKCTAELLAKCKSTGFLTLYTSMEYSWRLRNIYVGLVNVFNLMIQAKTKLVGLTSSDVDAFIVCYGIVDFVMQVFKATFKRKNLLFSTCAGFFKLASQFNRDEIIVATVG